MTRIFSVILLVVCITGGILAADFSATLAKIAAYNYGDSREDLTTLSDMLRQASADAMQLAGYEKAMLGVLSAKETTFAAKQYLCKELSIMGTELSVPTLANLLKSDETADIARYALERIPGQKVDEALLNAMKKSKGNVKIGVINTIGERKMAAATQDLAKLLGDKDAQIATAAAAALGKIGTDASATALGAALLKAQPPVRDAIVDAYLKNAEAFLQAGAKDKANAIYEPLFVVGEAVPTRCAALTGLIKTVDNPTELIVNVLSKDEDADIQAVAISMVHQSQRELDLPAIAATLPNLEPLSQIQLLTAFKVKGNPAVRDAVVKAVDSADADVSLAALEALAVVGSKADAEVLAKIAAASSDAKKEAAKTALARLNATGTDEALVAAIATADAKAKVELVEAIGNRMMTTATPTLLAAAKDPEARVRVAALKSLAQVATPADLPTLIDLLVNAQAAAERREAERTVVTVASKIEDKAQQGDAVIAAMANVTDMAAKSSLMLVAGRLGDVDALAMMREALSSKDNELKRAAILSLSEWPTPEPLADLENVAKTAAEPSHKVLGLRGFIQLLALDSDRPKAETVAKYQAALDMATDVAEKRMALSGLGEVQSGAAMLLAAKYLDDADLKNEAELAVLGNAWRSRDLDRAQAKTILQKVFDNTTDERVKNGAKQILDRFSN